MDTPFTSASGTVPMPTCGTPYAHWGDWLAWLCLGLTGVACLPGRTRRRPGDHARTTTDTDIPAVPTTAGR